MSEETKVIIDSKDNKKFYIPINAYAKAKTFPLWATNKSNVSTAYTNDAINNLIKNPSVNYQKLQEVSNYLFNISSSYQNIAYYLATIMTFDWLVTPKDFTPKKDTMMSRLERSAKKIHMSTPDTTFPMMTLRTIVNGETYWYDLSDNENTIYKEIPSKFCQLAMIDDDNLWRYFINLSLLKVDDIYEMPNEIQTAYRKWESDGKSKAKTEKIIDGVSVTLPDCMYLVTKNGFCMHVHMSNNQHDYPLLISMFKDFNSLENDKEYFNEVIKDQNVKLVHLKIPTDEHGVPLMEYEDISQYHESAKNHLPSNVAPLTNPFDVSAISVDSAQSTSINLVEHSQNVVQSDSGISKTMFDASTTNGLSYSVKSDASKMFPLLYFFDNLMTYKLKNEKFVCKFLHITHYNREEMHKQYGSDLANGGSRFMWMATSEMNIYQYLQTARLETLIDIDELLPAKMNANQMSGENGEVGQGRDSLPADEQSDETVRQNN